MTQLMGRMDLVSHDLRGDIGARQDEIAGLAVRTEALETRLGIAHESLRNAPSLELCRLSHERIARLEAQQSNAVTHRDLKESTVRVHARLDVVAATLAEVRGQQSAMARLLETIDVHLREHPRA